jgi:ParB/RepB/Spo0J family partition protein
VQLEFHQLALRYEALRVADPVRQARMTASIAATGQRAPVLVVAPEPLFVLIDGYCRVRALRALRRDTVEALVLELPEPDALLFAHGLDLSRPRCALEEGWFVRELHRTHGRSLADLALGCGHSVSWLSRRLALVERLPEPIQELVRRGKLLPHAAMKVLVPLARANEAHALRLATQAAALPERLSARQWEALYAAYRAATPEVRERLLDHPGLFVRVEQERRRPDCPAQAKAPEELLRTDLEALSGLARRARRRLRELPAERLDPSVAPALDAAWAGARADFDALHRLVTERFHDRPADAHGHPSSSPAGPWDQTHRPSPGAVQEHRQAGVL